MTRNDSNDTQVTSKIVMGNLREHIQEEPCCPLGSSKPNYCFKICDEQELQLCINSLFELISLLIAHRHVYYTHTFFLQALAIT